MNTTNEPANAEIEASLMLVAVRSGDEVASSIRSVLYINLKNGRVASFTENKPDRVQEYVLRVADHFIRWHDYLNKIQVEKDELVWEPLLGQLRQWTYSFFMRKGFDPVHTRAEIVHEQATEAAIQLLKANFPYDTEFEPWAFNIVKATCLKFMRTSMKKSVVPVSSIVELDDNSESWIEDQNPSSHPEDTRKEIYISLLAAINQLPPSRREIIIQKYFYELPSEKIAENTEKSVAAVYSLHFNAIENLRKIMTD